MSQMVDQALIQVTISTNSCGWSESRKVSGQMRCKNQTISLRGANTPSMSEREFRKESLGQRADDSTPTMKKSMMYKMSYNR